jgi:hypothetical protein
MGQVVPLLQSVVPLYSQVVPYYSGSPPFRVRKTSQMHENDQATIKTRYCGHLYSPFLRKWTLLDQRDQVSYYKERGLSGAWRVTFCFGERPCRVLSNLYSEDVMRGLKGGLSGHGLLASWVRPLWIGPLLWGLVSKGGLESLVPFSRLREGGWKGAWADAVRSPLE